LLSLRVGDMQNTRRLLEEAVRSGITDPEVGLALARLHGNVGDLAVAEPWLDHAVAWNADRDVLATLADALATFALERATQTDNREERAGLLGLAARRGAAETRVRALTAGWLEVVDPEHLGVLFEQTAPSDAAAVARYVA